ncbi:MAG: hypothetical protein WC286_03105 [Bacilli bacterium]|jgi:hypothetical protein
MRKLTFINEYGQSFPLSGQVLINGVEGLGVTRDNEYLVFSDRYKLGKTGHAVTDISLGLIFLNGYQGYRAFVSFTSAAKELILKYEIVDVFTCKIAFQSITKGELNFGTLQANLILHKLSPWLKVINKTIDVSVSGLFKAYQYSYPLIYGENANGSIEVSNAGANNAYMRIKIVGEVENPVVVIKKNDTIIGTLRLFVSGDLSIEVSSIPEDEYILVNGNDAYQAQDFTCKNFLFLPPGDAAIEFYPGIPTEPACYLSIEESYEGV